MKNKLYTFYRAHKLIGTVILIFFIVLVIIVIPGTIVKYSQNTEDVVMHNYFIGEHVPLHDGNYDLVINAAENRNEVSIKEKNGGIKIVQGNFIVINLTIFKNENSQLKVYKIGSGDFKLKNHTGVYMPLNEILGAFGWDALDIHVDEKNGGHIMSSTNFSTIKAMKDYNYYGRPVIYDELNLDIVFKAPSGLSVVDDLIVLEVDFYLGANDYKKGSDIILLSRLQ